MEAQADAGERAEGVGGRGGTRGAPEGAWRAVSATYGHAAASFCRGATASRVRAGGGRHGRGKLDRAACTSRPKRRRWPAKAKNSFFFYK
jgi:hypothetical protein